MESTASTKIQSTPTHFLLVRAFKQVVDIFSSGSELLRHFWSFSADLNNEANVRKCEGIIEHLEEIEGRVKMNTTREGKALLSKMMGSISKARKYLEKTK
jgi:hypothetical protein